MAEVIERSVAASGRSKQVADVGVSAAEVALQGQLIQRKRRRAAEATWSCTLAPQDLACLMGVIETRLLPDLLRSYRPADRKPLNGSGLA